MPKSYVSKNPRQGVFRATTKALKSIYISTGRLRASELSSPLENAFWNLEASTPAHPTKINSIARLTINPARMKQSKITMPAWL